MILNGDKMKTDIVMIVQIRFVSALDYSFDNYIVELCDRLELPHSPLVDKGLCTGDTAWQSCDGLRKRTPGGKSQYGADQSLQHTRSLA